MEGPQGSARTADLDMRPREVVRGATGLKAVGSSPASGDLVSGSLRTPTSPQLLNHISSSPCLPTSCSSPTRHPRPSASPLLTPPLTAAAHLGLHSQPRVTSPRLTMASSVFRCPVRVQAPPEGRHDRLCAEHSGRDITDAHGIPSNLIPAMPLVSREPWTR